MASKEKEVLLLEIVDGPSELDIVYSLLRRVEVEFTLQMGIFRKRMSIRIRCIDDSKGIRFFEIKGNFHGDGMRGWSTFPVVEKQGEDAVELEYEIWGGFCGTYDPRKRMGQVETTRFRKPTTGTLIRM